MIAVRQPLHDVALGLMGAESEGLGLRQGELRRSSRAAFASSHKPASARRRLMVETLRPVWAVRSSREAPSCISLANAGSFFQGRQILPLDVFHRGEA